MLGMQSNGDVGGVLLVVTMVLFWVGTSATLTPDFYAKTCPNLEIIVRGVIAANLPRDVTAPAALLRLFFHDCQVQGCDASILLDSQGAGIVSELTSAANFGIRRLDFIDAVKAAIEAACPATVSCADLVVLAAREGVKLAGGPFIRDVPLGRRDSTSASSVLATIAIPPAESSFARFLQVFVSKGMTLQESVAILGAHTLGVGHCVSVSRRLYPRKDPTLGPLLYGLLRLKCPAPTSGNANLQASTSLRNDITPLLFDTQYFRSAAAGRGLFKVDAEVASNPLTAPIVRRFMNNRAAFFEAFSSAFIKLSLTEVLTNAEGEIRKNCHFVN